MTQIDPLYFGGNTSFLLQTLQQLGPDANLSALSVDDIDALLQGLEDLDPSLVKEEVDSDATLKEFVEYRIYKALALYVPPLLLIMGTFGNTLSFWVLRNKAMTRQSTNLFLAALSIADSLVLLVGLLRRWIGDLTGTDIQTQADWACKMIVVFGYTFSQFSVWLIIAVTVERYIVVSHPLHTTRLCNSTRAKKVILFLALLFLLINLHLFWTVSVQAKPDLHGSMNWNKCEGGPEFKQLVNNIWPWIDSFLYSLSPFLIILFFNTMIIRKTVQATNWRGRLNKVPQMKVEKRRVGSDSNVKLTAMLLAVSFTFLLTTLPMSVLTVTHHEWNANAASLHEVVRLWMLRTMAELLMYLNHSINFFLYYAMGQKFRTQVLKTLCWRTSSNNLSTASDHSQHLYCSRTCATHTGKFNGYTSIAQKTSEETTV